MTRGRGDGSAAVGAEDFLARYAPNISRKERFGLTSMVREAVRDYMEENRLAQPPQGSRMLAAMRGEDGCFQEQIHQQQSGSPTQQRQHSLLPRRPMTARGWLSADCPGDGDERLFLAGSSAGIPRGTPRYANVSQKFAPVTPAAREAAATEVEYDGGGIASSSSLRHTFPDRLMGFVECGEGRQMEEKELQPSREDPPKTLPAETLEAKRLEGDTTSKTRPASAVPTAASAGKAGAGEGNWLSWRATTPFCVSDRELRAFRHRQNPRKPPPEDFPHLARLRTGGGGGGRGNFRPVTARGRLAGAEQPQGDNPAVEQSILSWARGASEHDKQLAYNLLKAMGSQAAAAGGNLGLEGLTGPPGWEYQHTFGRRTRPPTPARGFAGAGKGQKQLAAQPQAIFSGMEENFDAALGRRARPAQPAAFEYAHHGAGFSNACPPYRGNFVVHPDWVSEEAAPAPAPARRRPIRGKQIS